jgi:acetylornithine deacetylase/succinyl-diaminopimelate desuccinylase-like protein
VLPVDKLDDVARTLNQVLADPKIQLSVMTAGRPVPAYVPTNPKVMGVVTAATAKRWPGLAVIPQMSSGASDGIYLSSAGIPTYGVSGIFSDEDDVRAHGRNERVLVKAFQEAIDFMYDVCTALGRSQ